MHAAWMILPSVAWAASGRTVLCGGRCVAWWLRRLLAQRTIARTGNWAAVVLGSGPSCISSIHSKDVTPGGAAAVLFSPAQ